MKANSHWLLAACCLVFSAQASAAESETEIAHYQVKYVGNDLFQVDATFATPTTRLDLNNHAGSQRPNAQSESIRSLQAFDDHGQPVPTVFVGQGTWEMKPLPASRVSYQVIADHDQATWIAGKDEVATKFDQTFFFAGDAFFLVDYDWPNRPIDVEFNLPQGWAVTSPWTTRGTHLIAENADGLGTNAFAMGRD